MFRMDGVDTSTRPPLAYGSLQRSKDAATKDAAMSDRIAVGCPNCQAKYALPREFLGRKAACKKCGTKFIAALPAADVPIMTPAIAARSGSIPAASGAVHRPRVDSGSSAVVAANPLEDSVLAWLNAADDQPPVPAGKPRVVTTAELCDPSQRADVRRPGAVQPAAPARQPAH